jgi:uncharacterized protein YjdB
VSVRSSAAKAAPAPYVSYKAHVTMQGWLESVAGPATAGTDARRQLEAVMINIHQAPAGSAITYQTAVRTKGWTPVAANAAISGTTGQGLPVEAMRIQLTGPISQTHDIWYRMRVQGLGWMGWVKGNGRAGTTHANLHADGFQAQLLPKGQAAPGATEGGFFKPELRYRAHVQNVGWQHSVTSGGVAGTTKRSLRVEGLSASITGAPFSGSMQYSAHVQNIGWQPWTAAGRNAGTTGRSLRVEAIRVRLTGELANHFDIHYRVHAQNLGWLGWAKNGADAGTGWWALRAEAFQIVLVPKGLPAPGGGRPFLTPPVYQTPGSYAKISWTGIPAPAGMGFTLTEGREGAKVKMVADKFGLARPTQWVDSAFMNAVRNWQSSHGLPANGIVDKRTWTSMGFSAASWTELDGYRYPFKAHTKMTWNELNETMIATALDYRGSRYVWGGANHPDLGADCVGMVMQALYSIGLNPLPSTTVTHTTAGNTTPREIYNNPRFKHVPYGERQRGDLIFQGNNPADPSTVRHVQLYLGNGQVMEIVHIGGVARAENMTYPASMNMPTVVRPLP